MATSKLSVQRCCNYNSSPHFLSPTLWGNRLLFWGSGVMSVPGFYFHVVGEGQAFKPRELWEGTAHHGQMEAEQGCRWQAG